MDNIYCVDVRTKDGEHTEDKREFADDAAAAAAVADIAESLADRGRTATAIKILPPDVDVADWLADGNLIADVPFSSTPIAAATYVGDGEDEEGEYHEYIGYQIDDFKVYKR